MHITQIITRDLPPVRNVTIDCDERVNLFTGPNASGKSTILRGIMGLHSLRIPTTYDFMAGWSTEYYKNKPAAPTVPRRRSNTRQSVFHQNLSLDWDWSSRFIQSSLAFRIWLAEARVTEVMVQEFYDNAEPTEEPNFDEDEPVNPKDNIWDLIPFLYIPATRVNLPSQHILDGTIEDQDNVRISDPLVYLFDTVSGIFDGRYLELAVNWLRERMSENPYHREQFNKALALGYSCARSICAEVIHDDASHPYVELKGHREFSLPERIVHHNMGIGTTDDILGEPLYAGALSSGTQATLLWVWALTLKMVNHYRWVSNWNEEPAILLIDEIENHLHPTWQRRVIPALLEHFPGLQIFATTHSPFVVAGLKAGQVHLLKRHENGEISSTTNTEDIVGWTADEILRNMMGVDDPTDDETAAAARELRQLRNEEPRSETEEEAARQQRMQELRQRVDRDLLAGGPWKKQREMFEEQFAEALQKYRESKDMNQENG